MTGVGTGPAGFEIDTVSAGTRIEAAERVTSNAVVNTTGLGTVTGTTVRGTATEYAAAGSVGGSTGLTLTSSKGIVRYVVGHAPSGPMNESITEGAAGLDSIRGTLPTGLAWLLAAGVPFVLVDMGDDTFDWRLPLCHALDSPLLLVSLVTFFRTSRDFLYCIKLSLIFLGQ